MTDECSAVVLEALSEAKNIAYDSVKKMDTVNKRLSIAIIVITIAYTCLFAYFMYNHFNEVLVIDKYISEESENENNQN